jgi:hypothetical protein
MAKSIGDIIMSRPMTPPPAENLLRSSLFNLRIANMRASVQEKVDTRGPVLCSADLEAVTPVKSDELRVASPAFLNIRSVQPLLDADGIFSGFVNSTSEAYSVSEFEELGASSAYFEPKISEDDGRLIDTEPALIFPTPAESDEMSVVPLDLSSLNLRLIEVDLERGDIDLSDRDYMNIGDGSFKMVYPIQSNGLPGSRDSAHLCVVSVKFPGLESREMFEREMGLLSELNDRGLPYVKTLGPIFDIGGNPENPGVLMEFIPNSMFLEAKSPKTEVANTVLLAALTDTHVSTSEAGLARLLGQREIINQKFAAAVAENPVGLADRAQVLLDDLTLVEGFKGYISDLQMLVSGGQIRLIDPLGVMDDLSSASCGEERMFLINSKRWVAKMVETLTAIVADPTSPSLVLQDKLATERGVSKGRSGDLRADMLKRSVSMTVPARRSSEFSPAVVRTPTYLHSAPPSPAPIHRDLKMKNPMGKPDADKL